MRQHRAPVLSLAILSSLASLPAQERPLLPDARRDRESGMGRYTVGPLHLDLLTGQDFSLGCAYLNGELFVSARGTPHTCFVLDPGTGSVVRSFAQHGVGGSLFGWRDGASDDSTTLIFGTESAFVLTDANGNPTTTIETANGTRTLVSSTITPQFAPASSLFTVMRAVAYDRTGDSGNGSLWAADCSSDIVEFRLTDGLEIQRIPRDFVWSLYGLARHPMTGRLWGNSSPSGTTARIVEIDPVTGVQTGNFIERELGFEGGLDIVPGGLDGRGTGHDLLSLSQGLPDTLAGHRLDLYDTLLGIEETELLTGVDGGALTDASVIVIGTSNSTWDLDLDDGSPTPRALDLAAYFINSPDAALPTGGLEPIVATLFPSLSEIRYLDAFTTPTGTAFTIPTTEAASRIQIGVPGLLTRAGHREFFRVQAIYADARVPGFLPVMFTTQARLGIDRSTDVGFPPASPLGVRVSAFGPQSFNAITTSGFWRVENTGNHEILKVALTLPPTMLFDEDQDQMADSLVFGNSTSPGCTGTYRNNSHVTTDLAFEPTPGTFCDATSRRGYTLSNDERTLTFAFDDSANGANGGFTNGETFEFDADTDGGGVTADAHAGTVVSVWVRDTSTRDVFRSTGTMAVVSTVNPNQEAEVVF